MLPDRLDRRFQLEPGRLTDSARSMHVDKATEIAIRQENDWIKMHAPALSAAAKTENGCLDFDKIDPNIRILWVGYAVVFSFKDGVCSVHLEADPSQHRRRFRGLAYGGI